MELAEDQYYNENVEYQPTGNNINLRMDELVDFVLEKLEQYEYIVKATQTVPSFSPYKDPIIYTTKEGKTVQIPEYVHQEAIKIWNQKKNKSINEDSVQDIQELPIYESGDNYKNQLNYKRKKEIGIEENDSNFRYFILILLFVGILVYFYNKKK